MSHGACFTFPVFPVVLVPEELCAGCFLRALWEVRAWTSILPSPVLFLKAPERDRSLQWGCPSESLLPLHCVES